MNFGIAFHFPKIAKIFMAFLMDDELMISQDLKINCQVQPNFTFLIFIFVKPIWDHEKRPICPFTSENRFLQLLIERMIIKITTEIYVNIIWGHKKGQLASDADFFGSSDWQFHWFQEFTIWTFLPFLTATLDFK